MIDSSVLFKCKGGWQGGGISANGRNIDLLVTNSIISQCFGGFVHLRDGKGGGISVGGGLQSPSSPDNRITVAGSVIDRCLASGNGGGAYVTIRGLLRLFNTDIQNSVALNLGKTSQESFGRIEGMGGGIHISAGGIAQIVGGGHVCITNNRAAENGGGISVKSGRLEVIGHLDIVENGFTNTPTAGNGNGGGLYVTTSYHDDGWPFGAGFRAAQLYDDDGTVASSPGMVRIANNSATRWGGGVYVGLTPLLPYELFHRDCHAFVSLLGATITENNAMQASMYE